MTSVKPNPWLIFIDTNIFLDFYRLGESARRQLDAIDKHRGDIITADQVRMEFFKNRQKVIADYLTKFPKPNRVTIPPILMDFAPAKNLTASLDAGAKHHARVKQKIEQMLAEPARHDMVYKALRRLFENPGPLNLQAGHSRIGEMQGLARDRFALGYPPRKSSDTSYGDAVNWEWIVACAQATPKSQVLIVSRDGDYGVTVGDAMILNDWLKLEFADRVGPKRKIELTQRLTTALKRLEVPVSAEDEKAETRLISELAKLNLSQDRPGDDGVGRNPSMPAWYDQLLVDVTQLQGVDPTSTPR